MYWWQREVLKQIDEQHARREELLRQNQELRRRYEEVLQPQNQELQRRSQELQPRNEELWRRMRELLHHQQPLVECQGHLLRLIEEHQRENEELKRQNEEMQPRNQELERRNQELQRRIQEMEPQNEDLPRRIQELQRRQNETDQMGLTTHMSRGNLLSSGSGSSSCTLKIGQHEILVNPSHAAAAAASASAAAAAERDDDTTSSTPFRIHVTGMGSKITDADLSEHFSKYPGFLGANVVLNDKTGKSDGSAHASFRTDQDAQHAITASSGILLGGTRKIWCKRAKDHRDSDVKAPQDHWTTVFVDKLPPQATKDDVRRYFKGLGKVGNMNFEKKERGLIVWIRYTTHDEAVSAIDIANKTPFLDTKIECAWADKKPRRRYYR